MTEQTKTIIIPVRDITKARDLYRSVLNVEPYADESYYVGFKVGGEDVGLDPSGHDKGMTGPVVYWHVEDIKAALQTLVDGGAEQVDEIRNVGGTRQIAAVKDADGNVIGVLQD